jgi:hypothetical protein
MNFDKNKYVNNEKLYYNISLGILLGSVVLFGVSILVLRVLNSLETSLGVISAIGIILSMLVIVVGNIRLIRYVFLIRKQNTEVVVWKSVISIVYGLASLVVYWFILLLLALSNFT